MRSQNDPKIAFFDRFWAGFGHVRCPCTHQRIFPRERQFPTVRGRQKEALCSGPLKMPRSFVKKKIAPSLTSHGAVDQRMVCATLEACLAQFGRTFGHLGTHPCWGSLGLTHRGELKHPLFLVFGACALLRVAEGRFCQLRTLFFRSKTVIFWLADPLVGACTACNQSRVDSKI